MSNGRSVEFHQGKAQVIFDKGQPAFVVLKYDEFTSLVGRRIQTRQQDYVPFVVSDYIKNPLRVIRVKAGLSQMQFAELLGITQGYVSRMEARNTTVPPSLLKRAKVALNRKWK